jgi:hypothetical protein
LQEEVAAGLMSRMVQAVNWLVSKFSHAIGLVSIDSSLWLTSPSEVENTEKDDEFNLHAHQRRPTLQKAIARFQSRAQ